MKRTSILFGLLAMGLSASAQAPVRMTLYEEFTGETCPPCAATNPGLDAILAANATKVIALKWQVPIPSAPTNTWSLYQTNKTEIDWRYSGTGYNYPSQNTPTNSITNGINSAPSGRFDGRHQWEFGATSDHPGYVSAAVINSAQAQATPFSINIATNYDANFNNCAVTVTVTAASSFTANGNLIFRLCLVERKIEFATQPGTNGEKIFHDVVRKSFPTIQSGTALNNTWAASQVQTFTVNCAIPSYIVDKSQMAFVGFIQDDGNKRVWQAARSAQASIPNDVKLTSVDVPAYVCAANITPSINITNQGPNAITAMTIIPTIDGTPQTPFTWTGSLASAANTIITLGSYPATSGNHTVNVNIASVSGGDVNTANNAKTTNIALIQTYLAAPVTESFAATAFPPTNWFMINADQGASWSRSTAGLNGAGSARYNFFNNSTIGDVDELFVRPTNFTGVSAPLLTFDVAYAQYQNENDQLDVSVSTDCGATWTNVFSKAGSVLATVPAQTGAFTPASNNQWRNEVVTLPSAVANNESVLIKFTAQSDYGNMLYVDNINIAQSTTDIKTRNADLFNVVMYPNPASDFSNLDVTSKEAVNANITVYNTLGQVVLVKSVDLNKGYNHIELDTKAFASGVYNVVLSSDNFNSVNKLNVTK